MKKKNNMVGKVKGSIAAMLVALLAVGWLCTLYSMMIDRDLRE